jgi:MFS family permease
LDYSISHHHFTHNMSTFATGKPIDKKMQGKILLAIGLGALLTSFDSSSVVSILPVITHSLHSTINESKWVVTLYLLTISSLLLASGRLGDLFGHRRLYISGLQICLVGALLCALAPSIEILACFRIIEGIGGVLILANGAALLIKHCEFRSRGRMLGYLSSMAYIGLSSGPPLSVWLSDVLGWRSVFVEFFLSRGVDLPLV